MKHVLHTPRLEMIAVTLEIITADLHRRDELPALLNAELGEGWPMVLYDPPAMEWIKRALLADPDLGGWTAYYCVLREPRVLIGGTGFKSRPKDGVVELGYGMLDAYQRRGYATEAVNAMIDWAFRQGVHTIVAETLPELIPSQRLLAKCGFKFTGEGSEPGVMRFELKRGGGCGIEPGH